MPLFWGLILKAGEKKDGDIPEGGALTVAQASLTGAKNGESAQIYAIVDDAKYLLGTLQAGRTDQQQFDLNFFCEQTVTFEVTGSGSVHLVGYLQPIDDNMSGDDSDMDDEDGIRGEFPGESDEEDEDEDDAPEVKAIEHAKKAQQKPAAAQQKAKPGQQQKPEQQKPGQKQAPKATTPAKKENTKKAEESDEDEDGSEDGEEQPKKESKKRPNAEEVKPADKKQKTGKETPKKEATATAISIKCEPCNKTFTNATAYQQHKTAKHDKK